MRKVSFRVLQFLVAAALLTVGAVAVASEIRSLRVELPGQEHNAIKTSWPGIGCWFWTAEEFEPEGYKRFLDLHAEHAAFSLLTTSFRHPLEITTPEAHAQVKAAVEYAQERGMGLVLDLDVRLARQAYLERYPDEMQELVRLREVPMAGPNSTEVFVESRRLMDHYTFRAPSYFTLSSRLLRVYAYTATEDGIDPETVEDITAQCIVLEESPAGVRVVVPGGEEGRTACVMAAMRLFTPAVFAPHLLEFEHELLEQYADVPLAGVCKDEWGFPGRFSPTPDELWFSTFMAEAYEARRPGHDLIRDLLLMSKGERGREGEQSAAINHYMEMNWQRNAEIETDFYHAVKEVFGEDAMVGTHPTWYAFPSPEEVFKNGLSWWASKRDLAQTDEATPFAARTALAKKWHSPLWVNMYYDRSITPYEEDIWRHALGGGRMNFHPLFPVADAELTTSLLSSELLIADARIRLLNFISTAPLDCPVAVIFGHPHALNWSGDGLGDVGLEVTNALWEAGYYADLIPSSEVAEGALHIDAVGCIAYGPQRYAAAVLYQPQYERSALAAFFHEAAEHGQTTLHRVGDWTRDFDGNAFDGNAALPDAMVAGNAAAIAESIIAQLEAAGVSPQTPSNMRGAAGYPASMMPEPSGQARLLDGTVILASGRDAVMGDPIQTTLDVDGHTVQFDAIGVAAVRLDDDGQLVAMAAGGLRAFDGGGLSIQLDERADIALWRNADGQWQGVLQEGVLQGAHGPLPSALSAITADWTRLRLPVPLL